MQPITGVPSVSGACKWRQAAGRCPIGAASTSALTGGACKGAHPLAQTPYQSAGDFAGCQGPPGPFATQKGVFLCLLLIICLQPASCGPPWPTPRRCSSSLTFRPLTTTTRWPQPPSPAPQPGPSWPRPPSPAPASSLLSSSAARANVGSVRGAAGRSRRRGLHQPPRLTYYTNAPVPAPAASPACPAPPWRGPPRCSSAAPPWRPAP